MHKSECTDNLIGNVFFKEGVCHFFALSAEYFLGIKQVDCNNHSDNPVEYALDQIHEAPGNHLNDARHVRNNAVLDIIIDSVRCMIQQIIDRTRNRRV